MTAQSQIQNRQTFYHIEFAKVGLGVSGGETWVVAIIKKLSERGHKNILFTTDNGRIAYEKLGLIDGQNVEYRIIDSYGAEKRIPLIFSYIWRTFQAIRLIKKSKIDKEAYLISHSDFFPNTIPFFIASKKVRAYRRVCLMHIVCPKWFRGFENHFKGGFKFPNLRFAHHKFNQSLCFWILKQTRANILTNSTDNAKLLEKICPQNKVVNIVHFAATDIEAFKVRPKKIYDIVWVGRFHKQKGLLELPAIVNEVRKRVPDVKVAVIGGGNRRVRQALQRKIDELNLTGNFKLMGVLTGTEKDKVISESRVFAMTSFFESHSIVILEVIKLGTPLVAYNLPCHMPYKNAIDFTPMFDRKLFANRITELLTNKAEFAAHEARMAKTSKEFSWDRTTDEFLAAL